MSNKAVVHLRVYMSNGRDKEVSYNASGKPQNETILVKLTHDTLEWANYLKHLLVHGFVKVEVEKAIDGDIESIKAEVDEAMNPIKEVVLSPEQKKIADLEAKLDALVNQEPKQEARKATKDEEDLHNEMLDASKEETLEEVKAHYQKVMGKKPHYKWDIATMKEKIKNK